MEKHMSVECLLHLALLEVEACVLVTVFFFICVSHCGIHHRTYTKRPQILAFEVSSGQESLLKDVDYFRVDYTTSARKEATDDSDFIAKQMIRVPLRENDVYGEYLVALPADVLKVRLDTHYFYGKEHPQPIAMRKITWGKERLDETDFEPYYNRRFDFHGQCYTPKPFMRGYYVEYFWLTGVTVVAVFALSVWYFRKQRDGECV